jgi:uncharacterized protein
MALAPTKGGGVLAAALLAAALAPPGPARAALPVPVLSGPVVDLAGAIDAGAERRLEALARAARAQGGGRGPQLQFLVVPSLEGEPLEEFSMRVAEAWKLGSRAGDDGVLVTVAVQDRVARIEVGGGIEGGLTDVQSARIVRNVMAPAFREGRYGDGLYDAGVQILSALGALPQGTAAPRSGRGEPVRVPSLAVIALFLLVFVARSFMGFGPRRRRGMWIGGPWIGGGGGGFGGGGGWGGGGGGFSGGGASGRW